MQLYRRLCFIDRYYFQYGRLMAAQDTVHYLQTSTGANSKVALLVSLKAPLTANPHQP